MNLKNLRSKVRAHARDFNSTIFRQEDIDMFLNEGIDRVIQVLPQLNNIPYLEMEDDIVQIIPREYVNLLASYSVSRLFMQDERHYEATTFMNEFELKLAEFKERVENGELELTDPSTGEPIEQYYPEDYVTNNYFYPIKASDKDDGVEGV